MPTIEAEPVAIATARLVLRPVAPDDAAEVAASCRDWESVRYTTRIPHPYPDGEAARYIAEARREWDAGRFFLFAARRPAPDGDYIGQVGLAPDPSEEEAELSYLVARPAWGEGYGTEMARAALRFGFERLGMAAIFATVVPENIASDRLLRRLGMRFRDVETVSAPARGRDVTVKRYRLDRADWEAASA